MILKIMVIRTIIGYKNHYCHTRNGGTFDGIPTISFNLDYKVTVDTKHIFSWSNKRGVKLATHRALFKKDHFVIKLQHRKKVKEGFYKTVMKCYIFQLL